MTTFSIYLTYTYSKLSATFRYQSRNGLVIEYTWYIPCAWWIVYLGSNHCMHTCIQWYTNIPFPKKQIPVIYLVYTRITKSKSIYQVYTRYIPCLNFLGFPDGTSQRSWNKDISWYPSLNPFIIGQKLPWFHQRAADGRKVVVVLRDRHLLHKPATRLPEPSEDKATRQFHNDDKRFIQR